MMCQLKSVASLLCISLLLASFTVCATAPYSSERLHLDNITNQGHDNAYSMEAGRQNCQIAAGPGACQGENYLSSKIGEKNLYVCLDGGNQLAIAFCVWSL